MSTDELAANPTSPAPARSREIIAWAFYDFANSGYTTVVLTTVYSAFFVAVVAGASYDSGTSTLIWTSAVALANFCVLLSAPVVGAIADYRACKKRFLVVATVGCVFGTALLASAGPGAVPLALLFFVVSAIAFATGENLIAAFLPEIAPQEKMGRISGMGWGLGYFGGLMTLAACLAYISWAGRQGHAAADYVPVALLITAVIFALAATPTLLWLRERAVPRPLEPGKSYVGIGFSRVLETLKHARKVKDLFRFLGCLTIFQAGVATVVVIAAIYAQEVMGFSSQQLIVLIMVVNLTAALGALGFGFAQDRFGSIPSLAAALLVWILAITAAYFSTNTAAFWIVGNLIGLAMGATQAGGRALIGRLTPQAHSGEFFGLWGLASRGAAILGPQSYGIISRLSDGDHRMALLSTLAFFVIGLLLLFTVNETRGANARDEV